MSVKIVTTNHLQELNRNFVTAGPSLKIVTPFLSFEAIKKMIDLIPSETKIILVTKYNGENFVSHVNSLDALELLLNRGDEIYSVNNLHTKLYLFNSEVAIWGSANLTENGKKKNVELSTVIDVETEVMNELTEYFDGLVEQAQEGRVTKQRVDKDKLEIARIEKIRREEKREITQVEGVTFGVTISNVDSEELDTVQQSLDESDVIQNTSDLENNIREIWINALESRDKEGNLRIPNAADDVHYVETDVNGTLTRYYYWQQPGREKLQSIKFVSGDLDGNLHESLKTFNLRLLKEYLKARNWTFDLLDDPVEVQRLWKKTGMDNAWRGKEAVFNSVIAPAIQAFFN